jgi:hypothetical protein
MVDKLEDASAPQAPGKRPWRRSETLTSSLRDIADTHNAAMTTLVEHVLKAQAEIYKGQLAVVEHMIGQLQRRHRPSSPPPAASSSPPAGRTSASAASAAATSAAASERPARPSTLAEARAQAAARTTPLTNK